MQVPRFSPRISLIEMAPRPAPRSGCPSRPALPCLSPHTNRQTVTVPDDDAFPYGRFCNRNIKNAFAAERRVPDRRTDVVN